MKNGLSPVFSADGKVFYRSIQMIRRRPPPKAGRWIARAFATSIIAAARYSILPAQIRAPRPKGIERAMCSTGSASMRWSRSAAMEHCAFRPIWLIRASRSFPFSKPWIMTSMAPIIASDFQQRSRVRLPQSMRHAQQRATMRALES